ncbi:MAG TPA: hypothetical protein VNT03_04120 [Baekduia sp.]|nr:hypothetical protein [Baekduia sp.]
MGLRKLLRGAPATGEPRRRRRPRPGAPQTIVPLVDDDARPSWLPADATVTPVTPPASLALDLDAARDRLRREIPPVGDDDDAA